VHKTIYILNKIALAVEPKMQQGLRGIDPAGFSAINHITTFDLRAATILQIRKRSNPPSDQRDCSRRLGLGTCYRQSLWKVISTRHFVLMSPAEGSVGWILEHRKYPEKVFAVAADR
jgi:hypothetical protein